MPYKVKTRDEHFANDGQPKRILALDGGGLRGILTLGFLGEIERMLRRRHGGGPDFRLCHYFDLIAGTSTGAIIAAALAMGWTISDLAAYYMRMGEQIFTKSLFRKGLLRAKYDKDGLVRELKKVFPPTTDLGSNDVKTGLLVVTKRLDTGSPWPLGNNPRGRYFELPEGDPTVSNARYPLWQVVRASTAAPAYFEPERITIIRAPGKKAVVGEFVDGGVSPFNNPALQALLYATLEGYRVGWPTGADKLLLVSVGTGAADPSVTPSKLAASNAVKSLVALLNDSTSLMETLLQWMSKSPTARVIDRELGKVGNDLVGPAPLLTYLRYNVTMDTNGVRALDPTVDQESIDSLSEMDAPQHMPLLKRLGELAATQQVHAGDFPETFDL